MTTPIECRRNAAGCLQAAKETNTSENLRRMFLGLARGWNAAADRLERKMGLRPADRRGAQTATRVAERRRA